MILPWTTSCGIFFPAAPYSRPSSFYVTVNQTQGEGWSLVEMLCKRDPPLQEKTNTSKLWHMQVCQFSCRCTTQEETHLFPCFHCELMSVWIPYRWHDTKELQNDRVLMFLGILRMCHAFSIYQQRSKGSPGPGFITLIGFCYSTTTIKQYRKTLQGLLVCLCQLVSIRHLLGNCILDQVGNMYLFSTT